MREPFVPLGLLLLLVAAACSDDVPQEPPALPLTELDPEDPVPVDAGPNHSDFISEEDPPADGIWPEGPPPVELVDAWRYE